jgi:hypothetical protein
MAQECRRFGIATFMSVGNTSGVPQRSRSIIGTALPDAGAFAGSPLSREASWSAPALWSCGPRLVLSTSTLIPNGTRTSPLRDSYIHVRWQYQRRSTAVPIRASGPHFLTLARWSRACSVAERPGVLQPSGAVAQGPTCQPARSFPMAQERRRFGIATFMSVDVCATPECLRRVAALW